MAKKQKKSLIGKVAMAAGAVALGMAASPVGQQVTEQAAQLTNEGAKTEQVVVKQRMTQRYQAQRQQAKSKTPRTPIQGSQMLANLPYLPGTVYVGRSMSPREYGEWLMYTGKNKQHERNRKHLAKAFG